MSVAVEAAGIMEVFQWKRPHDSLTAEEHEALALECADVFWYLLRLCAAQDVDLASALHKKIWINEARFPVESGQENAPVP